MMENLDEYFSFNISRTSISIVLRTALNILFFFFHEHCNFDKILLAEVPLSTKPSSHWLLFSVNQAFFTFPIVPLSHLKVLF